MGNHDYDEDYYEDVVRRAYPLNSEYGNAGFKSSSIDAHARIHQLEAQCATLAAEVDRMRPVVQAAIDMKEHGCGQCEAILDQAVTTYESSRSK